jgi:hypothetical protein
MSALVIGSAPAAAQSDRAPQDYGIDIVDQTTFVAADGTIELVVEITRPLAEATDLPRFTPDGVTTPEGADDDADNGAEADGAAGSAPGPVVSATFFGRLEDEAQVDQPLTQPINRLDPVPVDALATDAEGRHLLSIPVRSVASFDDRSRVLLREPGVYPITVELRDVDGPLASVRTHVVRLPPFTDDTLGPADVPIPVAVVLAVSTAEGLSIDETIALLAAHPDLPLTVLLGPGMVNQLRAQPDVAAALAAALGTRPVLSSPTVDLDPSALAEIDRDDLFLDAARQDRQVLLDLGLEPAPGVVVLDAPLTAAGVGVLDTLDVTAVLDPANPVAGIGRLGAEALDDPTAAPVHALRPDHDLNAILGGTDPGREPALGVGRANRVLARLTLRPVADEQAVVIGGESLGLDPAPALDAFLRALRQPGAPRPVPLDQIRGGPAIRLAERPEQDLREVVDLLDGIDQGVDTYRSFHRGGGLDPDEFGGRIVSALTRQRNPDDRLRALLLIASQLERELGVIDLPDPQPVTLAARSASIPLVMDSTAAGPRQVLLRLRSDKVISPDDGKVVEIEPGVSSLDVGVEARSLGVSPLEVSVWTPDGETRLAATRFEIRSTAIPGLGLLVSVGALGLLGLWWYLDLRGRRTGGDGESGPAGVALGA